ncbi:hypothetical protein N0V90_009524 [Kalmusia sp. IMI 367209]|nr:hypothetical protein N0V90_009524 [Kalmusia sp. IMI 367209]
MTRDYRTNVTDKPADSLLLSIVEPIMAGSSYSATTWENEGSETTQGLKQTACGYYFNSSSTKRTLMSGYTTLNGSLPLAGLGLRALPLINSTTQNTLGAFPSVADPAHVITNFLVVQSQSSIEELHRNTTPSAMQCELFWCTQTTEVISIQGRLTERKTAYHFNPNQNNAHADIPAARNFSDITINSNPDFSAKNVTSSEAARYFVSAITALSVSKVLDEFLPFRLLVNSTQQSDLLFEYASDRNAFSLGSSNPWTAPANISTLVEQIAEAMTTVIRQQGAVVKGMAWIAKTHVNVDWAWITSSAVLLLTSMVFFIAVMLRTRKDRIWKNSIMGVLQLRIEEIIKEIPP